MPDALVVGAVVTGFVAVVFICGMLTGTSLQTRYLRRLVRRIAQERRGPEEDPEDR